MRVRKFWTLSVCAAWLAAMACADDGDPQQQGALTGMSPGQEMPAAGMAPGGAGTGVAGTGATAASGGTGAPPPTAGTGAVGGSGATAGDGAAGMEAAAGTAGLDPTDAGGSEPPPAMHEDLGMGDGSDVVTIGDSWMNFILTGIEQSLDRASGQRYRHHAVPGTLVLNEQIPRQYAAAVTADADIKTVIMTGGGNDILSSGCSGEACYPIVDDVSARLDELMAQMGEDGVQDIVLIGYTYPSDMGKHASLDYSIMLSSSSCVTTGMPRCHFVDSTMLDITLQDGIHPNAAGYDLIGQTVWELMQREGVRR